MLKKNLYLGAITDDVKSGIEAAVHETIFRPKEYAYVISCDDIRHIKKHYKSHEQIADAIGRIFSMLKGFDTAETYIAKGNQRRLRLDKGFEDATFRTINTIGKDTRQVGLVTIYITRLSIDEGTQVGRSAILSPLDSSERSRFPLDESIPETGADGQQFSDRAPGLPTARQVLVRAFEGIAETDTERKHLTDYRAQASQLDAMERALADLRQEMKGTRGDERAQLQTQVSKLEQRIDVADRKLLRMRNATPLKSIVRRERDKAYRAMQEKSAQRVQDYRTRTRDTISRRDRRTQVISRVKQLDKLLRYESDQKHIPEGFKRPVLDLLELFTDNTSVFNANQLANVQSAYAALNRDGALSETSLAGMYDADTAEMLEDARTTIAGRRLSELSMEELDNLKDIVDHFQHIVRKGKM